MSISSRIEAIEQHLTDDYNVLEVAGADLTNVDKNILNLKPTWKERLLYFMNNGTQEVWDNWDKVTGEGTTITLNNTEEAPMKINLKGNTSQEGTPTPETPQDIHVVSGDNSIDVCGVNLLQKQGYGTPYSDSAYWVGSPNWLTSGDDGWATFSVDNSSGSSALYRNMMIKSGNAKYKPSTNYTIFVELDDLSLDNATGDMLYLSQGGNAQDPFNSGQKLITYAQAPNKVFKFNVTTKADLTNTIAFRTFAVVPAGKNVSYKIRAMIVEGNYEKNTYEPYTSTSYPISLGVENLWKNQLSGFLPQSGAYPVTNSSYPNSKYIIVPLLTGQKLTLSGSTSGTGRVRYIDKDTNQVVGSITSTDTTYYSSTHGFGDAFYEATITAKKDFLVGIMDYGGTNNVLIVNYGATPQYVSDNPIELCKIGDYQDKIDKSSGKNLFDKDSVENDKRLDASGQLISNNATGFSTTGYIKVKPNTKYTYSRNITSSSYYVNICEYTSDKTHIQRLYSAGDTTTKYVFTTPSNCEYLRINDATTNLGTIQLEEGDITTPVYEPYGTGWYLKKEIGKVVLNGSESWTYSLQANVSRFDTVKNNAMKGSATSNPILSTHFKSEFALTNGNIFLSGSGNLISITDNDFSNTNDFKNWLSSNNVTCYYALATPTYTEITDSTLLSQLNALAKSYTGQTNISQENNDLASLLNATALREMS